MKTPLPCLTFTPSCVTSVGGTLAGSSSMASIFLFLSVMGAAAGPVVDLSEFPLILILLPSLAGLLILSLASSNVSSGLKMGRFGFMS